MNNKKTGIGRGNNPNSVKNLKPIKPGENRNPEGGRTHDKHLKALKKFTSEYLREVIDAAVLGNLSDLTRIMNDPKTPAIEVGVARVLFKAISEGDWDVIEKVLARIIGKVPDKVDHTTNGKDLQASGITVKFVDDGIE